MYPFILLLLLFYTIVFIWCCHFDPNRLLYLLCMLMNTRNWSNYATVIQWKKWVIIFTGTTLVPFPCYFPFPSIHKQKWTTPNSLTQWRSTCFLFFYQTNSRPIWGVSLFGFLPSICPPTPRHHETWLFKSFKFESGGRMSDKNLVILEFKYVQNKKWLNPAVKSAGTKKRNLLTIFILFR